MAFVWVRVTAVFVGRVDRATTNRDGIALSNHNAESRQLFSIFYSFSKRDAEK